jgi:hypothetical protein
MTSQTREPLKNPLLFPLALLIASGAVPVQASQIWYVLTDSKSVTTNNSNIEGSVEQVYNSTVGSTTTITNFGASLGNTGSANVTGLTSSFDQTSAGISGLLATSFASADLATGVLKAQATNTGNGPNASSSASFSDTITYNNPGGGVINVGISYIVDGGYIANNGASVDLPLTFGSALVDPQWNSNLAPFFHFNVGWLTEDVIQLSTSVFDFTGTIAVSGVNPVVQLTAGINLTCDATVSCDNDFSDTGVVGLTVPQGVTYTSASGVFLTQAAATPEPSTFGLSLLAMNIAGAFFVRRRIKKS